jgi:all-trans-retinol 13,14-reductase
MRYIILGAGLSGLSCGIALAGDGHEVLIIEMANEVGGLARSRRIDGYTFDYGPHFLFGPKVLPLLNKLTPELDLIPLKRRRQKYRELCMICSSEESLKSRTKRL